MNSYRFLILTPRECVYEGAITSLVLPTEDGLIGFLAGREETAIEVMPGDFRFRDDKGEEHLLESDGGVFEMTGKEGVFLCGAAYHKAEAEEKKRERAELLAENKRRQEQSIADYKLTRAALMRAFDKLKRSEIKN